MEINTLETKLYEAIEETSALLRDCYLDSYSRTKLAACSNLLNDCLIKSRPPKEWHVKMVYTIISRLKYLPENRASRHVLTKATTKLKQIADYLNYNLKSKRKRVTLITKQEADMLLGYLTSMKCNIMLSVNKSKLSEQELIRFTNLLEAIDSLKFKVETGTHLYKTYALHKYILSNLKVMYEPIKAKGDATKLVKAKNKFKDYVKHICQGERISVKTA